MTPKIPLSQNADEGGIPKSLSATNQQKNPAAL